MSKTLNLVSKEVSECTKCSLAEDRKQPVFGTGSVNADLMLIGEGPGAEEDRLGVPFVGRSGKLLDTLLLEEMNIDRSLCYISNVVKCRPPENRDPKAEEVEACSPYLKTIRDNRTESYSHSWKFCDQTSSRHKNWNNRIAWEIVSIFGLYFDSYFSSCCSF